ncbi:MAG: hypothetical protein ACREQM_22210 [Candidatus Dormibacteraceae bacterium]
MLLAAGGVWLGNLTPRVEVSVTVRAYTVGGEVLSARGGGVYQGSGGVVVIRDQGSVLEGAASATYAGHPMTARCSGTLGRGERCRFQIGNRELQSVDGWSGSGWSRRYGDGKRVDLEIAQGRPVPVPVPVDA